MTSTLVHHSIALQAVTGTPLISILLPFDPKITGRNELATRLEWAVMHVKEELDRRYAREETYMLTVRLRKLIDRLNYGTYKKSIAIYLSVDTESVFYLDVEVESRISVNGPLTMRHIVQSKKDARNYWLLVINAEHVKIFNGNFTALKRIQSFTADSCVGYNHDLPERVSNFSDPSALKETMLEKFLRYTDHCLQMLLVNYPFPVIVLATDKICGHFKKFTRNSQHVAAYIHGNFEDATESSLRETIMPALANWESLRQQHLLLRLERAMGAGKLVAGVRKVCKEASLQKGHLLVVEKSFTNRLAITQSNASIRPFYMQDSVDEAIAMVLASGGDVEFVDDGSLMQYKQIALIKYY